MAVFVCYPKCSTCKKAEKWLQENNLKYDFRDIKLENPTKEDLKEWHEKSGLDIKRFFNTSGMIYRELQLKDKLPDMGLEEKYEILATDGMLVKRPILVTEDTVVVGFKQAEWEEKLKRK